MYALMSIDALLRIAFAMALLFIAIPLLAWPRRRTATTLEWFFWNLGVGMVILTVAGQVLTFVRLFSFLPLLFVLALIVLLARSAAARMQPWMLVRRSAERAFLAILNVFDGRVNVPRRIRRRYRRALASFREKTASRATKLQIAGWAALAIIAAGLRLYRPIVTANLGFSDTYVHLYFLKLLEQGVQVDPDWGPYPRGMHFLLLAIHQLTNVDQILLLNFFGAIAGALLVLAVADTARRLSGSVMSGLLAGFLFATLVGGPGQYFAIGGAFDARNAGDVEAVHRAGYDDRFDTALTLFHRQTSTLPQELALVLLFPGALFLLDFLRKGERWHLAGFAGSAAAMAAVHSGVLVPLILMCAVVVVVAAFERNIQPKTPRRAIVAGALAVLIGSTWTFAFALYPYAGGKSMVGTDTSFENAAFYYFPFLRSIAGGERDIRTIVDLTPFLVLCVVLAAGLIVVASRAVTKYGNHLWISCVFLLLLLIHFSSMLRLPQAVDIRRSSQSLTMAVAILVAVAIAGFGRLVAVIPKLRIAAAAALILLLAAWTWRVPLPGSDSVVRERIVHYSGYGASALAVLRIERSLEPYTWTIVSYGQEFPMVLRKGFHLPAADFLDRYDPSVEVIPIPTPQVFIIVEKTPHPFQINVWAQRFSRTELQQRLQTWVHLYQATHRNLNVFLEDENVRVYQISRTPAEIRRQ